MDRNEALATCFANLKGPREKDLLATAEALRYLKSLPDYDSNAKVGQALGVSGEIIREFLSLLMLPESTQKLFQERKLGLEHGRRLWQLSRKRPELVEQVAKTMVGLTSLDSRYFVDYILRHSEQGLDEAYSNWLATKTVRVREYHVVAIVDEATYRLLRRRAHARKQDVNELVSTVVKDWLLEEDDG